MAPAGRRRAGCRRRKQKKSYYAQSRIEMAVDHDKIWKALERVCPALAEVRVKKLAKDFPEVLDLVSNYPRLYVFTLLMQPRRSSSGISCGLQAANRGLAELLANTGFESTWLAIDHIERPSEN
jgi:hypothetical protein